MMRNNPFTLEGKNILVTGGAGGIGSATALACINLGARVILTDIRKDALESVLALLPESLSGEANLCYAADLINMDELAALIEFCPRNYETYSYPIYYRR